MKPFVTGLIVAAGGSTRMGTEKNKVLLNLGGIPVIARTMLSFEQSPFIDEIVVVCRETERKELTDLARKFAVSKFKGAVKGGETRQKSVFCGIQSASECATHFAIHDGARGLITPAEIKQVVTDAVQYGAAALGTPVKDTIKQINRDGFVDYTPERALLWAVQTPQVFERKLYESAMAQAAKEQKDYTDDCQLVENMGVQVYLSRGSYENIKITTPDDLALGEHILKLREEEA